MKTLILLPLLVTVMFGNLFAKAAPTTLSERRAAAKKLYDDGNWKEALQIYEGLLKDVENSGPALADDLGKAVDAEARINQMSGFDALAEAAVKAHPKDWRLLRAA